MKKFIGRLFTGAVLSVLLTAAAFAASEPFVVKDGEWFRQSGSKLSDAPTPNGGQETGEGAIYWLFADPEFSDEAKGAKRGLYFYAQESKKYSYMPFGGDGVNVNAVHFSPNGEMFIVEGSGEEEMNDIGLELFSFADKKSLFKTGKAALEPQWIDAGRFVYSRFEPGTSRGRPDDYPDEWMSASMFDAISGEETVLKKATKTSDFSVGVMDEDTGDMFFLSDDESKIRLTETYVKSPKDWEDPDKAKTRELTVPVPAATFESDGVSEQSKLYLLKDGAKSEIPDDISRYLDKESHAIKRGGGDESFLTVDVTIATAAALQEWSNAEVKPGMYFLGKDGREFGYLADHGGELGEPGVLGNYVKIERFEGTRVYYYPELKEIFFLPDAHDVALYKGIAVYNRRLPKPESETYGYRVDFASVAAAPLDAPDKSAVVAEGTATADYTLLYVDDEGIHVQKESVEEASDWMQETSDDEDNDYGEINTEAIVFPLPHK